MAVAGVDNASLGRVKTLAAAIPAIVLGAVWAGLLLMASVAGAFPVRPFVVSPQSVLLLSIAAVSIVLAAYVRVRANRGEGATAATHASVVLAVVAVVTGTLVFTKAEQFVAVIAAPSCLFSSWLLFRFRGVVSET